MYLLIYSVYSLTSTSCLMASVSGLTQLCQRPSHDSIATQDLERYAMLCSCSLKHSTDAMSMSDQNEALTKITKILFYLGPQGSGRARMKFVCCCYGLVMAECRVNEFMPIYASFKLKRHLFNQVELFLTLR